MAILIRNKTPNMLSHGVSYQTSGFNSNNNASNVVVNTAVGDQVAAVVPGFVVRTR